MVKNGQKYAYVIYERPLSQMQNETNKQKRMHTWNTFVFKQSFDLVKIGTLRYVVYVQAVSWSADPFEIDNG